MSLGGVAARLALGAYAAPAQVLEDVRQVWRACRGAAPHAPSSETAKAGEELSGFVDQLWRQAGHQRPPPATMGTAVQLWDEC